MAEIMFQNVAYRATVYRTGAKTVGQHSMLIVFTPVWYFRYSPCLHSFPLVQFQLEQFPQFLTCVSGGIQKVWNKTTNLLIFFQQR